MSDGSNRQSEILLEIADGVGTIMINRPDRRNSFTIDMLDPWHEAIEECRTNSDVRAVVLTGAGDEFFCGGGDTSKLGANVVVSPQIAKAEFEALHRIARGMRGLDKPSIAAVNGVASGAGMDMALHCDIRILATHARMSIPYLRFGLYPGNGAAYFLPRIVGTAKALELIWSGQPIDSDEALRLGLANKVAPSDSLRHEVAKFAQMLVNSPPLALKLIRRGVYQSTDQSLDAALELTSSNMAITRTSADHAEAIAAYTEKRTPVFRGE